MESIALKKMVEALDLPDSAYEAAKARYENIGEWLDRPESASSRFAPHIFAQGSFRLGTAIRPLDSSEAYDLDLACRFRKDITKSTHTQKDLKDLIGRDLESYRTATRIESPLEAKHRCWRLEYKDKLSFHMDIVPCIPAAQNRLILIKESMLANREDPNLAEQTAEKAVAITDDRLPRYDRISDDWLNSNPEGYALWFESRMKQEKEILLEFANREKVAQVDDLPSYPRKSPLQRAVQLLKRHRDTMFRDNPDLKPISAIITTLSARAYQGESTIESAIKRILDDMDQYVNVNLPRVPNPVNPTEDFADRWGMSQYKDLKLEENFKSWLINARHHFGCILGSQDAASVVKEASENFAISLNESELSSGFKAAKGPVFLTPRTTVIETPARPWEKQAHV